MLAAQAVRAGDADLLVAGGFESMSRAPFLIAGRSGELKFGNQELTDALLIDGLWDPFENWGMGQAAEFIADEYEVTREAMDRFALQSHQKAIAAQEAGRFKAEIVPVEITGRKGETLAVEVDEGPRKDTSLESLSKLKPSFKPDGKVTAGNSSPMNDGAAAVVIASERYAGERNLKPLARVVGYAQAAVEPKYLFAAPAHAIPKLLEEDRLAALGCGSDRAQRGLCRAGAGGRLRPGRSGLGLEQGQCQRRRHRTGTSAGRQRRARSDHSVVRTQGPGASKGHRDAVPGRRRGRGHGG